jgi:hypothetical protein
MNKPTAYLNQRIKKETVKRLRKYEKKNGLKPSVSATIDNLLDWREATSEIKLITI